jgi:putative transposase
VKRDGAGFSEQWFAVRHRIFLHLTWTTRYREPLIDREVAKYRSGYFAEVATQERALPMATGIVADHVHLLVRAHPTMMLPRLMQRLKGSSEVAVRGELGTTIAWAKGYSVRSVSLRAVEAATSYVRQQERRDAELVPRASAQRLKSLLGKGAG